MLHKSVPRNQKTKKIFPQSSFSWYLLTCTLLFAWVYSHFTAHTAWSLLYLTNTVCHSGQFHMMAACTAVNGISILPRHGIHTLQLNVLHIVSGVFVLVLVQSTAISIRLLMIYLKKRLEMFSFSLHVHNTCNKHHVHCALTALHSECFLSELLHC